MRLRTTLLLLVLATAVPLVAFALLASVLVVRHQQENYATAVKDRNRAFMSAVDAELKASITTLQGLAASRSLERNELAEFYEDANAVLRSQPSWFNVILVTPEGQAVVDAAAPWGTALVGSPVQPDSLQAVVRTLAPAVGSVAVRGPYIRRAGIPVRVPVVREARLAYVLTALIKPEIFGELIRQQRLPEGWVSGLVDARGRFIARVPPKPAGSLAGEEYRAAVRARPEGWYRGETVEGLDTYTAHVKSNLSGWSVGFAIPTALVLGGANRAAALLGGGVLLSLALAAAIALWLSRRITQPMSELASAAPVLGSAHAPIAVKTGILEVAELSRALHDASRAITDRDAELRLSEERFRRSQEAAIHGFILFRAVRNGEGRIADLEFAYINPAGAALSGRKPEELIGRKLSEAFPGSAKTALPGLLARVAETGTPIDTELHYEADGVDAWYRHLAVKIGDGVGTSFTDVTAKRALDEELQARAEALSRADRAKSEFLAMLSHELRNPLAPLMNGLALLKAWGGEKGRSAEVLAMMERQIRQLTRLIDDLLDISRIDRGKLEFHRERLSLDGVVRSAVEIARPNIEGRSHELVLRYPGAPLYADVDPVRMAQVVSNVLNNAAKFTPPGGRIEVALKADDGRALISVADNGIGLEPADADSIFDMFVQLDSSRSQAAGGLGLGLTLARTIVERHHGRISAESEGAGKGTRITIALPAAAAPKPQPQLRAVGTDVVAPGRRILVVDDNEDAATTLARVLEHAGHEVRSVFNGLEAIFAAEEFRPQVIVLDLNLPGIDGVEVGRRLRAYPWFKDASLIALTGMGQPADLARTRAAGFDHHMTKPVHPDQVLDVLGRRA